MIERSLASPAAELCFPGKKMAFVSGPRQCGKTTLAKMLLEARDNCGRYLNWDSIEVRRIWAKNPTNIVPKTSEDIPLVVLDEIHKVRGWKRSLKGIWDTLSRPVDFLVTGSARLAVYRKGSDSLLGRYFAFRLHPLSLVELDRPSTPDPDTAIDRIFDLEVVPGADVQERFEVLLEYGPFPEPALAQSARRSRLWRRTRIEAIIREDLRDLSRIPDLSRVEMLASLLPERVGSLLSVQSLREDLEVAHPTAKRWLLSLTELYYAYLIRPYQKRITRSLRQAPKAYLWDWSEVKDRSARFENLIAGHLLKACHFWTDTGEGEFELHFLRNKEKQEIDFLITRDGHPWLPVEVKRRETLPSPNWARFLPMLGCDRGVQLIETPDYARQHRVGEGKILVASASRVLDCLL